MKKVIYVIAGLAFASSAYGASGVFGAGVVVSTNGTKTLYELTLLGDARHDPLGSSPTLDSTGWGTTAAPSPDLGTFNPTIHTFEFNGGELLTWKNGGSNVSGANIYYKIDGGAYSSAISLAFNEDNVNGAGGDQRWYTEGQTIDLLSGLSNGVHTLSVYLDAPHDSGTHYENNGTADFGATFTVVPEPSTTALLGLGGLALVLRRRK